MIALFINKTFGIHCLTNKAGQFSGSNDIGIAEREWILWQAGVVGYLAFCQLFDFHRKWKYSRAKLSGSFDNTIMGRTFPDPFLSRQNCELHTDGICLTIQSYWVLPLPLLVSQQWNCSSGTLATLGNIRRFQKSGGEARAALSVAAKKERPPTKVSQQGRQNRSGSYGMDGWETCWRQAWVAPQHGLLVKCNPLQEQPIYPLCLLRFTPAKDLVQVKGAQLVIRRLLEGKKKYICTFPSQASWSAPHTS